MKMLTIIVFDDEVPQDWSLVERFFNRGVSSGALTFFRHQASRISAYQELLDNVAQYLQLKLVDKWKLVWVMNISQEKDFRKRLSIQLERLQMRFLNELQSRRIPPEKMFVIALDSLARNVDGTPLDPFLRQVWELDIYGYLTEKRNVEGGNLFIEHEFDPIDQQWGDPLDLREAGPLEAPKQIFLELLELRISATKMRVRDQLLIPKRECYERAVNHPASIPTDMIRAMDLNTIETLFNERLDQLKLPPLSRQLSEYKPSQDLKAVIKEVLGTKASIAPYVFIRAPYPQDFPAKRIRMLLNIVYTLHAISLNSSVSRLWQVGNAYTLAADFSEEGLQTLLSGYLTRLYIYQSKVEDTLRDRRLGQSPDYEPLTLLPYAQEILEDREIPQLILKRDHRLMSEQELQDYGDAVRELLNKREQAVGSAARVGIRKLAIHKKQREEPLLFRSESPREVIRYLDEQAATTREELASHLLPPVPSSTAWDEEMGQTKQEMAYLLHSVPRIRQVVWMFVLCSMLILTPYFLKWRLIVDSLNRKDFGDVVYPAIVLIILLLCLVISRLSIIHSIQERIKKSEMSLRLLLGEQADTNRRNRDYLNKLYKLTKLRQRRNEVRDYEQLKDQEHLQLRHHQAALQAAIDMGKRLSILLGIQIQETNPITERYDDQAWFELDSLHYPIYCPLWSVIKDGSRREEMTEIVVGLTSVTIREPLLYPATRIQYDYDQVYRL
jgi:hypothetical protein